MKGFAPNCSRLAHGLLSEWSPVEGLPKLADFVFAVEAEPGRANPSAGVRNRIISSLVITDSSQGVQRGKADGI
jgi:hypothetical protein